jgi:voltage-gated potassium channel
MKFLSVAVGNSMHTISIFILFVLTAVVILGSIIHLGEGQANGFTGIPQLFIGPLLPLQQLDMVILLR